MALAPSLTINLPGYPFENFPSVETIADLRAIASSGLAEGDNYVVDGATAAGDGGGGVYSWNDASVAADDGVKIIKPTDTSSGSAGRWFLSGTTSLTALVASLAGSSGAEAVGYNSGASYSSGTVGKALQDVPVRDVGDATIRVGVESGTIDDTVSGSILFQGTVAFPNKLGVNNTKPVSEPSTGSRSNDTGYVAGAADVAAIGAGYDNVNNALAGIILSQHGMLYYGADHSGLFAGSLNTILSDAPYSVCLGGTSNTIQARGRYAAIIAGDQCQLTTGASDSVSGFRGFIAASSQSTVGGRNGVILTSVSSAISSTYGTILSGENVTLTNGTHMLAGGSGVAMGSGGSTSAYSIAWGLNVTMQGSRSFAIGEGHSIASGHDYSTARGLSTVTPCIGSHVFSARQRGSVAGRNQALDLTCSQETTDTTTTRLSVAGSANYPTQPADSIVTGTVWVTGVNTASGVCSSFKIDFTSERVGTGTPTLRANSTTTLYNGLVLGTVPTMNVTSGGIYRVQVVGLAATNIAWDARIVAQQIVYTP